MSPNVSSRTPCEASNSTTTRHKIMLWRASARWCLWLHCRTIDCVVFMSCWSLLMQGASEAITDDQLRSPFPCLNCFVISTAMDHCQLRWVCCFVSWLVVCFQVCCDLLDEICALFSGFMNSRDDSAIVCAIYTFLFHLLSFNYHLQTREQRLHVLA